MRNKEKPLNLFTDKNLSLIRKFFINPLYGRQDIFESAAICNRCGACNQSCPSYKVLAAEAYSPRGRNQLLKFLTERKIKNTVSPKSILEPAKTCIMCGQCSAACAAYAPANKHMTALKNVLKENPRAPLKKLIGSLLIKYPNAHFNIKNLKHKLPKSDSAHAIYLPAQNMRHSKKSLQIIEKEKGPAYIIKSGLMLAQTAFTGDLKNLQTVLNNIKQEYDSILSSDPLPLITDDIELYRILKLSPEIDGKYQNIADNAAFISQFINIKKKGQAPAKDKKIVLQNNNVFFCDDKVLNNIISFFNCGKSPYLVELVVDIHSAGLMPYTRIKGKEGIERNLAKKISLKRADYVIVLSSKDEDFFNKILKTYYPTAQVVHISRAAELFYEKN